MKCVIQRVKYATCEVDNKLISQIGPGLLVLVGFCDEDNNQTIDKMLDKILNLRILSNDLKTLNYSVLDLKAGVMIIPNFTLYANTERGRRPSFELVGNKIESEIKYNYMLNQLDKYDIEKGCGQYSADMQINLQNDGPVTLVIEM